MITASSIAIIADDLTGANDTALQFHLAGAETKIILYPDENIAPDENIKAWAIPTETRNISPQDAYEKVKAATLYMKNHFGVDSFYKKIDSTIRGNIAVETLGMLQVLDMDAAIIIPAFPNEGRVTIGGYHLLKGVPIEKTEMASDPHSPIYESHIPTILEKQVGEEYKNIIGSIELKTVLKGAGPILNNLNVLVKNGKKLIVVDAVSSTDIEQVILAMHKCSYNILPCGSAGAAQALSKLMFEGNKSKNDINHINLLPKLVIAGSATHLCANQIAKLIDSDEVENTYPVSLTVEDFINGISEETYERIKNHLVSNTVVVVHASEINKTENLITLLLEHEITKRQFATKIVEILANLTGRLIKEKEFLLTIVGGETAFCCCRELECQSLKIIDAAAPAIPLCVDNKGRMIITKSGNLGTINTLVEILKYIERHE